MPNVFTNAIQSSTTEGNTIDSRSLVEHDNESETSVVELASLIGQSKDLNRDAANRFWNDRLREHASASSDQLTQLAQLVSVERKHVACVRAAHEHVTGRSSEHDHTKDTWYMVVTALVFSMHLKELVSDVMDDVIGDHVTAEPHHEAYFERTKGAPSDDNVLRWRSTDWRGTSRGTAGSTTGNRWRGSSRSGRATWRTCRRSCCRSTKTTADSTARSSSARGN
ncbi:hypothetical protein NP493_1322g00003 [Ridgeia piscesae]|uniref:Uncharacterized protein n=1 Tax=Ridgeia piscesae TaxID=27915 RepID=A0AAD9NFK7_RIDPI|nr:hypothetical protein NP493_1322g00003 [Ridgeia piscesae]